MKDRRMEIRIRMIVSSRITWKLVELSKSGKVRWFYT